MVLDGVEVGRIGVPRSSLMASDASSLRGPSGSAYNLPGDLAVPDGSARRRLAGPPFRPSSLDRPPALCQVGRDPIDRPGRGQACLAPRLARRPPAAPAITIPSGIGRRSLGPWYRKIERDQNRFKQIVRGKIKADLRKYITHGEMIGKTGGELVSIPLPQIQIPEFRYGPKNSGGVGQGPGEVGQPIGRAGDGDAMGSAGDSPGHHILEVELTLDELAEILGEGLALPRIEPKGRANIIEEKDKYTGIRQAGPESLRHFKRTYKKALKRQIASSTYNAGRPDRHPGPRGQAVPVVEPDASCPTPTPSCST